MSTPADVIHDHMLRVTFNGMADSVKSTAFFNEHRDAIKRDHARVVAGIPLPPAPRPPTPSVMRGERPRRSNGTKLMAGDFRTIPTGGIFGASHCKQ